MLPSFKHENYYTHFNVLIIIELSIFFLNNLILINDTPDQSRYIKMSIILSLLSK